MTHNNKKKKLHKNKITSDSTSFIDQIDLHHVQKRYFLTRKRTLKRTTHFREVQQTLIKDRIRISLTTHWRFVLARPIVKWNRTQSNVVKIDQVYVTLRIIVLITRFMIKSVIWSKIHCRTYFLIEISKIRNRRSFVKTLWLSLNPNAVFHKSIDVVVIFLHIWLRMEGTAARN